MEILRKVVSIHTHRVEMFSYAKAAPKSVRLIGSEGQIIVLTAHVPVVLGRGFPVELVFCESPF